MLEGDLGLAESPHVGIRGWSGGLGRSGKPGHSGMEPVVRVERAQCRGRMLGVVVAEFCHGKQVGPVGLLVVAVQSSNKVLRR